MGQFCVALAFLSSVTSHEPLSSIPRGSSLVLLDHKEVTVVATIKWEVGGLLNPLTPLGKLSLRLKVKSLSHTRVVESYGQQVAPALPARKAYLGSPIIHRCS